MYKSNSTKKSSCNLRKDFIFLQMKYMCDLRKKAKVNKEICKCYLLRKHASLKRIGNQNAKQQTPTYSAPRKQPPTSKKKH